MDITKISDISEFLGEKYDGENFTINGATSLDKIKGNTLAFSKNNNIDNINCKALILVPVDFNYISNSIYGVIRVKNPRLEFAKIVNRFFIKPNKPGIHNSTIVGDNCKIDPSVSIGANCVIGDNVKISRNTRINNNVVLHDNTILGENCYLKSGCIIGEDGFGFDFEEDGTPVRIPHIGNVTIGNDVEVGSNTVIVRGTLNSTIIKKNVKIDDQVFIAHNCNIGENTVIIASAEISGSVIVGSNCWIGPNSSIMQKVVIGDNATIGMGAVITKNVESNKKIMGLNGIELRGLVRLKKRIQYGK